jgi:hypothetical protein
MVDVPGDVLDLLAPAAVVHAEGLVATVRRQLVEARFAILLPEDGSISVRLNKGRHCT